MDLALEAAQKVGREEIFTDGPLIHNPQALETLRSHGVVPLQDAKGNIEGTVIIRSHGISPQRYREIEKTGAKILDATCPKVKQAQSIIDQYARKGFYVVIIGDADHAEVKGLLGFVEKNGIVIQNEHELKNLPSSKKICVVAQTTQNREKFFDLSGKIRERFPEAKIFDTICEANRKRQEELKSLCKSVDAIIIVGGRESGNTKRLVGIAKPTGVPTFFGENEDDLDLDKLKRYKEIGIIGGASTPDWVLKGVIRKLEKL